MIEKWPQLERLVQEGVLAFVDLFFARSVQARQEAHAALLAALYALAREGHLVLNLEKGIPFPLEDLLRQGMDTFPEELMPWIHRNGNDYYLQKNWICETTILDNLARLKEASLAPLSPTPASHLNPEQREGVEKAMLYPLSILTGGPGTGKTFTAAQIVSGAKHVILTAPTGKAVAQLEKGIRAYFTPPALESATLHSLLGIGKRSREEPISLSADLILVDECSMIDAQIFAKLLERVATGTRLVLIGDKHQLPPVEAGSIFADLVDTGSFPTTELKQCLRSDQEEIIRFSQFVREGQTELAMQMTEVRLPLDMSDPSHCQAQLWERCHSLFPSYSPEEPDLEKTLAQMKQFSLLSCMRKGPLGVDALNNYFYCQYSKSLPEQGYWAVPIMIVRNHYGTGLFNGDQGVLVKKWNGSSAVDIEDYACFTDKSGGIRKIPALALPAFEYCYCLSVHKSQGSEYEEVLILAPEGAEGFGREVLYTAVTRARRKALIAAPDAVLQQAIASSSRKNSGIQRRLK